MNFKKKLLVLSLLIAGTASAYTLKDTLNPVAIYTGSNTTPTLNAASDGSLTGGPTGSAQTVLHNFNGSIGVISGNSGGVPNYFGTSGNGSAVLTYNGKPTGTGLQYLRQVTDVVHAFSLGGLIGGGNAFEWHSVASNTSGTTATVTAATQLGAVSTAAAWNWANSANKTQTHTMYAKNLTINSGQNTGVILNLDNRTDNAGSAITNGKLWEVSHNNRVGDGGFDIFNVTNSVSGLRILATGANIIGPSAGLGTATNTMVGSLHGTVSATDQFSIYSVDRTTIGTNIYLDSTGANKSGSAGAGYAYLQFDRGASGTGDAFKFLGNTDTQTNGAGGAPIVTNDKQLLRSTLAGTIFMGQYANGTVSFTGGTGQITSSSDRRLKTPVDGETLPGLAEIIQLTPVKYRWNDEIERVGADNADKQIGFYAQDVLPIIPEAVGKPSGSNIYYGLYDRPIIAALVNAVKELKTKNDTLETNYAALAARVAALEAAH